MANTINALAGGNLAATAPGYGDGGPGSAALFSTQMNWLGLHGGVLYVADVTCSRFRSIALTAPYTVNAWVTASGCVGNSRMFDCFLGCSAAWDSAGTPYFYARARTSLGIATATPAIVRGDPATAVQTLFAGGNTSATPDADGIAATTAHIAQLGSMEFDLAGDLLLLDSGTQRLRQVAHGTGVITTRAGTGVAGAPTDYVLGTASPLSGPQRFSQVGGHDVIADTASASVRWVW